MNGPEAGPAPAGPGKPAAAAPSPAPASGQIGHQPPPLPSWGKPHGARPARIEAGHWRQQPLPAGAAPMLARGNGRSYGDVGLNAGGTVLLTTQLDRFMVFDREHGVLRCEAGMRLDQVLDQVVPHGWLPPVLPGTAQVTLGGAVANDIHGKNHHHAGSFGRHVRALELLRSDGSRLLCSPDSHPGLFAATIGGLGLTGLITWVELQLLPIPGPWLQATDIRFTGLAAFHELSQQHADKAYTVAWVDALVRPGQPWRGLFSHAQFVSLASGPPPPRVRASVPVTPPWCLPRAGLVRQLNALRWRRADGRARPVHLRRFFFPLDGLGHWNRLYGRGGLVQHQSVLPPASAAAALAEMQATITRSGQPPLLAVLKTFGHPASPGLLSFPRPGTTLAVDFPWRGAATAALLQRLDEIVAAAGGAVYPAKDAHMTGAHFRQFFPAWRQFMPFVDPAFSSGFWRRVMADAPPAVPAPQPGATAAQSPLTGKEASP